MRDAPDTAPPFMRDAPAAAAAPLPLPLPLPLLPPPPPRIWADQRSSAAARSSAARIDMALFYAALCVHDGGFYGSLLGDGTPYATWAPSSAAALATAIT